MELLIGLTAECSQSEARTYLYDIYDFTGTSQYDMPIITGEQRGILKN